MKKVYCPEVSWALPACPAGKGRLKRR